MTLQLSRHYVALPTHKLAWHETHKKDPNHFNQSELSKTRMKKSNNPCLEN